MTIQEFFQQHPRAAVAFSGGTDSAYLLWAGKTWGQDVRGYYVSSPFQPAWELADARRLARELDVPLTVLPAQVLSQPEVAANPANRCYHCKRAIFTVLWNQVRADGFTLLLDGTNASDDPTDRPGMKALTELEVRSPLRECGITKAQVRRLSQQAGLFTWDKPAYACLATRIPTGTPITQEDLTRVEAGEDALFALGFTNFRLRLRGDTALLQLPQSQMEQALACRSALMDALSPHFAHICLDLQPRQEEESHG